MILGLFFGFFLPGDSLLLTAGLFAAEKTLNLWILLPLVFVAAVLGLLSDPDQAERMGARGREHVRERFLLTRWLRDELRLLGSLAAPRT